MINFDDIDPDDIEMYISAAYLDGAQAALDLFMADYIKPYAAQYAQYLQEQMAKSTDVLAPDAFSSISMSITSSTIAFKENQKAIYENFIRNVYGDAAAFEMNVTNPAVIEAIKTNTIATFNELIDNSLQGTASDVLATIRQYQYDLINQTNIIASSEKFLGVSGDDLQALKDNADDILADNNTDFFNMLDNGNFVRYSDGKLVNMEDYNEMATRTTALNVHRDAVEMQQAMDGERISEYLLIDDRPLKTDKKGHTHPREICQEIMAQKWQGVSLIAHDAAAAEAFGIYTIDEAKDLGAMGPNCRHGIQPLDEELSNMVDNILYVADMDISGDDMQDEGAA